MKRLFNKDVPFITYIIHDKNMKNGRTVTVYKPTQEYYILFELIKFRRLPATFPDIGITVISEGLEPSPSDVSVTQDVTTPEPPEDALQARIAELEVENAELKQHPQPIEFWSDEKKELYRRNESRTIKSGREEERER